MSLSDTSTLFFFIHSVDKGKKKKSISNRKLFITVVY